MEAAFLAPAIGSTQCQVCCLFSHLNAELPHLDRIRDPHTPRTELAVVRHEYNMVRLHATIGYLTPDDEHEGRGPKSEQRAGAGYDTPAGHGSHHIESNKPKPTAGAPPMWTNLLPDLWL